MRDELSFEVRGARIENPRRKGRPTGNRETEILMQSPGDPMTLEAEPENPADGNAIAVYSKHGVQMGYIAADRTHLIRNAWHDAKPVQAIFQRATAWGAVIRISFDGNVPSLPPEEDEPPTRRPVASDPYADEAPSDLYPDPTYDD